MRGGHRAARLLPYRVLVCPRGEIRTFHLQCSRLLAVPACLFVLSTAPGAAANAPQVPSGHEASSGVGVVGGGFITATAIWVTPRLTDQPSYREWVPGAQARAVHRRAAASHTVMLLELANQSRLRIEGYLSLNVRLLVHGEYRRPVTDRAFARTYPSLLPHSGRQRIAPGQRLLTIYAFPKVAAGTATVALIIRPLWLFDRTGQVGQVPDFELLFHPGKLDFP